MPARVHAQPPWVGALEKHAPCLDRLGNILEPVPAHRRKAGRHSVAGLLVNILRDADPAWLSQALESGGEVDALAEDVAILVHHVAEADPDAETDPLLLGSAGLMIYHGLLHLDSG